MPKNLMRALAFCGAIALSLSPFSTSAAEPAKAALKVAFVYVSPVGQAGWSYQHDLGRREMLRALDGQAKATVVEAVAEGADAERVMRDLAAQGHQLIFATSFGYLEPALKVAADFPAVKFEHAGGYKTAANLGTYDSRYYEARYLAGMVAGHGSKSGVAGYVAGFPVPEVVQGINAFALGMLAVNPQAQVKVVWLNSWFDPARERDAALTLVNQGADVLTNHSGSPAVPLVAEEKGVKLLAYQSDMSAFAPHAQLAAVTHQWGAFYTRTAREVLAGQWRPQAVWGGMREGQVRLSALSKTLPAEVTKSVLAKEKEIVAGRFVPFSGQLVDNHGQIKQTGGTMADAQIAQMNWFVQGVVGSVPAMR